MIENVDITEVKKKDIFMSINQECNSSKSEEDGMDIRKFEPKGYKNDSEDLSRSRSKS